MEVGRTTADEPGRWRAVDGGHVGYGATRKAAVLAATVSRLRDELDRRYFPATVEPDYDAGTNYIRTHSRYLDQ